jgi:hypothetical protein
MALPPLLKWKQLAASRSGVNPECLFNSFNHGNVIRLEVDQLRQEFPR